MGKKMVLQMPPGLKRALDGLLPDGSGEKAHRARMLMVAGLIVATLGMLISAIQMSLWVHPAFPPAPRIDLVEDALALLVGGLVVWLVKSGRIRAATWVVLGSLSVIAVAHLYTEGRPAADVGGELALFLVIVLALVLLDRRSAWLIGAAVTISFVGVHILWLGGHLPQPVSRERSSQVLFAIFTWLATAGTAAAVISSTVGVLRKHRERLEEMVDERTLDLQEAQRRIAEILELNQSIITASSLGITVYDASGDCVVANEAAARIIGTTQDEVLKQNLYRIGSWQTSGLLVAAEAALASGSETQQEVHVVSTFGQDIWIICRFVPFSSGGEPHLLLLTDDVTEERELQEQLVHQEKLAVLGQLADGMGHEMRNPLGAIKNAAYFLRMALDEPEPEVRETLEIVEKEVDRSERIISSLLDFARAKPPNRRRVDLNEVVQAALSRTNVPEDIQTVLQLDDALPTILADPDQLAQVFGNLIRNAVQAMPDGGRLVVKSECRGARQPEVARGGPKRLTVSIADTGVGIPEENLEKIFEPLFTTKAKGIGLGLAIVKTLVKGHGGAIEVESPSTKLNAVEPLKTGAIGAGSTFTVCLPTGVSHEEA